ncbi:MAG TPA: PHP domain-containing protein [Gemmatimonadota bacterium]|nr:PHP domain-containing protein [Gemmatimonadota bacterium]
MSVDLHTHTTFSDGALTPAELVARAAALGISVLAITDHDATDAHAEAVVAAPAGLQIVTGTELTCQLDGREAHVLAYGFDPDDACLRSALETFAAARVDRAREIVRRLNDVGVKVGFEEVAAIAGAGTIGRPHVAQALIARGHTRSLGEGFTRYLGRGAPAFVEKKRLAPKEAFRLIRAAGGVAVLAHPGTFRRDDLIPLLVEDGLEGLEVRHTEHSAAQSRHYEALAAGLGLLTTGGSDFHGTAGHRSRLGFPDVPDRWAAALVARSGERH